MRGVASGLTELDRRGCRYMIVGVRPDGSGVILDERRDEAQAEERAGDLRRTLEDYEAILVEPVGSLTNRMRESVAGREDPRQIAAEMHLPLAWVVGWINGYRGNCDAVTLLPGDLGDEDQDAYGAGKVAGLEAWAKIASAADRCIREIA